MSHALTFVELFAGVGGMSRGLEMAGWRCVGHAEWDTHPQAVLRKQWPDVPLWGDVAKLNGRDIVQEVGPFTMLTFGAPCQDFSIAGKREGMDGERSVLVLDALRIWEESGAPLAVYENVVGMLSSNQGADFAGILSVFVGDAVAVPPRGWKGGGGVVRGCRGVAAWRVLDAQYFGVPQRRRRVFVVGSRTPDLDPVQVLSLLDGVSGHPAPRRAKRQGVAADAGAGVASGSATGLAINISNGEPRIDSVMGTLQARAGSGGVGSGAQMNAVLAFAQNTRGEVTHALVLGVDKQNGLPFADVTPTLKTDVSHQMGPIILRQREGKPGGGKGPLLSEGQRLTLGTTNDQVVFPPHTDPLAPRVGARDGKGPGSYMNGGLQGSAVVCGVPRRLTPLECERLMGWDDGWTAEGIDEQGRPYPLSDTARYKACGNGVASPVAAWVGFRLREVFEARSWEVPRD